MKRRRVNYKPSRPQAAISFIVGLVFVILGVTMVIPGTFGSGFLPMGLFGLAWTGIAVYYVIINGKFLFGEKKGENENLFGGYEITEETTGEPPRPQPPEEVTHDHIRSTALGPQKRLEQLETLRDAGLLTEEEYREKRGEILREL